MKLSVPRDALSQAGWQQHVALCAQGLPSLHCPACDERVQSPKTLQSPKTMQGECTVCPPARPAPRGWGFPWSEANLFPNPFIPI